MKHSYILFLIVLSTLGFQANFAQTANLPDAENIKTVILKSNASNSFAPIIRLDESFILSFDDIEADEKTYYYEIEHLDYNWQKSDITVSEYLIGFNKDKIRNYENSFNTLQFYTHYQVTFPNDKTQLIQSGNYIIKVLNDDNEVVFIRKFVVYNPKVDVAVSVQRTRTIEQINTHQNVQFVINLNRINFNNPSEEVKVRVLQNNLFESGIKELKPQFVRANQLMYKYDNETNFWAGNEFLNFDNKIIRNTTFKIRNVYLGEAVYYTHLTSDEERVTLPYTYFPDVNGNFIVRNLEGENASLDADYTWVHFYLKPSNLDKQQDIYVYGAFNNWQLSPINKMKYNKISGLYELPILLKQGFYNYRYVSIDANQQINYTNIDGSFYQTENEYTVLVYYRKTGNRFDEVIGIGTASSDVVKN